MDIKVAVPKCTIHDKINVAYDNGEVTVTSGLNMPVAKKNVKKALAEFYDLYRVEEIIVNEKEGTVLIKYLEKEVVYRALEKVLKALQKYPASSLNVAYHTYQDRVGYEVLGLYHRREPKEQNFEELDDNICHCSSITIEEVQEIKKFFWIISMLNCRFKRVSNQNLGCFGTQVPIGC